MKHTEGQGRISRILLPTLCAVLLLCSAVMTLLLVTEAKYRGEVNRMELALAQPLYFSSNYLSDGEGNTYSIQGWDGNPYSLTLEIRNYDNSLLYNTNDMDFALGYRITEGKEQFTLNISDEGATEYTEDFTHPESWGTGENQVTPYGNYTISGGSTSSQKFNVVIAPVGETALPANTRISFELFAVTNRGETYALELRGTFTLQVATDSAFIGVKEVENRPSMVSVSIKTNPIAEGASEKIVVFHWRPDVMYLNEFDSTAFKIINNKSAHYDRENGLLYVPMQAYSRLNLEFFKHQSFTAGPESVVVEVVDSVNTPPTGDPVVNLPTDPENPEDPGEDEGNGPAA